MENSTTSIDNTGNQYDKHDVTYTNHLKHLFNLCNIETQTEFNDYNPIMSKDVFSRI